MNRVFEAENYTFSTQITWLYANHCAWGHHVQYAITMAPWSQFSIMCKQSYFCDSMGEISRSATDRSVSRAGETRPIVYEIWWWWPSCKVWWSADAALTTKHCNKQQRTFRLDLGNVAVLMEGRNLENRGKTNWIENIPVKFLSSANCIDSQLWVK